MAKWEPGQSGNPGGRPKEDGEVKALARQHTVAAIDKLAYWLNSDNAKASVSAAIALLDRGYGKPAQSIDANILQETIEERLARIANDAG